MLKKRPPKSSDSNQKIGRGILFVNLYCICIICDYMCMFMCKSIWLPMLESKRSLRVLSPLCRAHARGHHTLGPCWVLGSSNETFEMEMMRWWSVLVMGLLFLCFRWSIGAPSSSSLWWLFENTMQLHFTGSFQITSLRKVPLLISYLTYWCDIKIHQDLSQIVVNQVIANLPQAVWNLAWEPWNLDTNLVRINLHLTFWVPCLGTVIRYPWFAALP